jgi:hypothetical protein
MAVAEDHHWGDVPFRWSLCEESGALLYPTEPWHRPATDRSVASRTMGVVLNLAMTEKKLWL